LNLETAVAGLSSQGHSPEQGLQVLRQLCAPGIARVHGDEDADSGDEAYYLSQEVKLLFLGSNCILDTFYLNSQQGNTRWL
jgi:hypothetical protein